MSKQTKAVCCWCGHNKTKSWCPPYGMVCSERCAEFIGITGKVRYPDPDEEKKIWIKDKIIKKNKKTIIFHIFKNMENE